LFCFEIPAHSDQNPCHRGNRGVAALRKGESNPIGIPAIGDLQNLQENDCFT